MAHERLKIRQDRLTPCTSCRLSIVTDLQAQMRTILLHLLCANPSNLNQLMIISVDKCSRFVKNIGKTTSHPGTKVTASSPENNHQATGHVFTTMVSSAFDDSCCTRISDCKSLTRTASRIQGSARCAIKASIANNGSILARKGGPFRWCNHQTTASHPFTHVVVGISTETHFEAWRIKHTKALTGCSFQIQTNRSRHSFTAMSQRNFT